MRGRYRVWLDGQALDEIDDRILVLDVVEAAPEMQLSTAACAVHAGSRLLMCRRLKTQVQVRMEVHEADIERRQEILGRVAAWCRGRVMTVNNRPGQRLLVQCIQLPGMSALHWTEQLTLTFAAYEQPYWEDELPTRIVFSGEAGTLELGMTGTAETMLCASVQNASAKTCDQLMIQGGEEEMWFDALGLAPGECLRIDGRTPSDLKLVIAGAQGERTVYHKRQPRSADALMLSPGVNRLNVSADTELKWTLMARGRYE